MYKAVNRPAGTGRLVGRARRRDVEVSRRTIMRDLDFLRDDENAP